MEPGLPDDIFVHLFRFCDIFTTTKMTMLCHKMAGPFVWRRLSTLEIPPPHTHLRLDYATDLIRALHRWRKEMICLSRVQWHLELSGASRQMLIEMLISVAPQLKVLDFTSKSSDHGTSPEQQRQLISRLDSHRLEELSLPFYVSEEVLQMINHGLPKLKQLRIRASSSQQQADLIAPVLSSLATKTTKLERLYIHIASVPEQLQLLSLIELIKANPNLHRIHLFKWNIGHKTEHPYERFFPRIGAAENFGYSGPYLFSLIEAAGPSFPAIVRVNNESLWQYFMGMNASLADAFDICERYFSLCHCGDGPLTKLIDFAAPLPQLSREAEAFLQLPQALIDWLDETINALVDELPVEMRGSAHSLAGKAAIRAATHFAAATFKLPPNPEDYAVVASSKPFSTLKRVFSMLGGQRALMAMLNTTGGANGQQPDPTLVQYKIATILLSDKEWCGSIKLDPSAYDSSGSTLLWYLERSPEAVLAFLRNSGFDPLTKDVDGEILITGTLFRTITNATRYPAIYADLLVQLLELHSRLGIKVSTKPTISSPFLSLLLSTSREMMESFARVFPDSAELFLDESVYVLHVSSGMLKRLFEFLKIQSIIRGEAELPEAFVAKLESRLWNNALHRGFSPLALQFSISEILSVAKRLPEQLLKTHLASISPAERDSFLNVLRACGVTLL